MIIKYKNLIINFKYACSELDDDFGNTSMIANTIDLKSFFESMDWTSKDEINSIYRDEEIENFMDSVFPENDEDEPDLLAKLKMENADLMILFFYWAMQKDTNIAFDYSSETPMWLMHDLIHAKNDCMGDMVAVDQYSEERAVFQSMDLANELGLIHCFNVSMIIRFSKEFMQRFGHPFPMYKAIENLNELIEQKECVI